MKTTKPSANGTTPKAKSTKRKYPLESTVLREVMVALYDKYKDEAFVIRFNTGTAKKGKYNISFHSGGKGFPDLVFFHSTGPIFIEVKSAVGKLSPEQEVFQERSIDRDMPYLVIKSSEDALQAVSKILYDRIHL
jgi:hypothetical protein